MKSTRIALAAAVALAMAAAIHAFWRAEHAPRPAPEVSYTLLDGSVHSTADLRGKVVLMKFWATSCVPCVREMPQLVATHRKFRERGLQTLAVAMSYDPPALVSHFAQSRGLPFGVVIDNTGAIARSFDDVKQTPTTVLIDAEGRIVLHHTGAYDAAALHVLVEKLLSKG
jgi:peroxiredoxin